MRRSLAVLAIIPALVASLAAPVAPAVLAAAAKSPAKVVIVVGATHSATAKYRGYADAAYAEAIKYTSNVVKVYSPNATWSKVKSAAVGASVLIYFGHGNGWPSPYTYDPQYTTKDGMGLNADLNGDGKLSDYENKYYGEPSVATLDLAPNAIVLLHHLCYASGNSEPGQANPTVSVARQRISNYAAGFLKSNAQAVIADGHRGPVDYLRALFTTDQTIESMWRTMPGNNGNASSFTSTRTSGVRALMDPETPTSGFYRSLVTDPTLVTSAVTGVSDTSGDPASFVVPGRASVATADAPLFVDPAAAAASTEGGTPVASGTRLAVVSRPTQTAADGAGLLEVEGLDDPGLQGVMRAADLLPRDSAAPRVLGTSRGIGVVSPNGDDAAETITVSALLSETASWRIRISDGGGATVHESTGSGANPSATWDGRVDGVAAPDGTYTYSVVAIDGWANQGAPSTGTLRVDTLAPTLDGVTPSADATTWFSPNGDGLRDTITLGGTTTEGGSIVVRVRDTADTTIRSFSVAAAAGAASVTWDGKANDGSVVPDGEYEVRLTPRDAAGNTGTGVIRTVGVVGLLGTVTTTKPLFYAQDLDSRATGTRLSLTLARPATVTWTIRNAAGTVVATLRDGETPAGITSRMFYGRTPEGVMLPVGRYTSSVTATDGTFTVTQAVAFEMDAFSVRPSTSVATRGKRITITAISAESLASTPRLYVTQPGKATWVVTMTKTATLTYKATITLKTGGSAGKVTFKVLATDTGGNQQRSYLSLTLK